ncbi:MAG: T9SS C-terminal target domain-containing protein [Cytophagales bacterium]|nr:MAG: T9SS C-terminal target domain-containing protein [Cytophagales bacterium]
MPHFSCSATSLTGIGTYAIEVTATGANISNYELTVYNVVLTITKATLTVTANNFSRVYGSENPTFTGIALGIVNNDMITQTYSSTATSLTGIGTYDIQATATGANINNYQLITFNSVLTVTKANLTVTANNFSRVYGTENPTFTGIALGIVNNDIIDLSYTTSATETSNVGKYQINVTASGVNIYNYELKLNNGTLTINLAPSNATVTGASTIGPLISVTSITISGTGFVNGATVTVNSVLLSNFTIVDGTTIIATFPVGTLLASNNVILVQNPNQVASANTSITIENIQITTNLPTFQSSNINIYPNPSTGAFTIESPLPINEPIVIYNILGVAVQTISSKGENTIKISGLTTGMYLVQIGSFKQKVMVE